MKYLDTKGSYQPGHNCGDHNTHLHSETAIGRYCREDLASYNSIYHRVSNQDD